MQRETWAVLLLLIAGAAIYAHITTTTEEFSRYNIGWNGTSGLTIDETRDLNDLDPEMTLLILAPDQPFSPEEVGYLQTFLDDGGRVLIADEEGDANQLIADLGSAIRVRPGNLSSLDHDHAVPGFFTTRVVGDDTLFAGVKTVRVNRPAAVEGGRPLLETSIFTWDDADGDGRPGETEIFGAAVVCAKEKNIIVLGDPSLFINAMLAENPEVIKNLQPALIDAVHSRTGTKSSIITTRAWIRETPAVTAVFATLAILPIVFLFGRKRDE